jgi:hypothetical protein
MLLRITTNLKTSNMAFDQSGSHSEEGLSLALHGLDAFLERDTMIALCMKTEGAGVMAILWKKSSIAWYSERDMRRAFGDMNSC